MRSDYLPGDLKRLWQELASDPVTVTPDALRSESRRLRSGVRLRNSFVVVICSFVMAAYGVFLFKSTTLLERIGCVLSLAGAANVIVQFLKRPARTMPVSGAVEGMRFYRAELERHRDFHRGKGVISWLPAMLPGPFLFNIGFALAQPALAPLVEFQLAAVLAGAAIVVPLNLRMARRFQGRIDALDSSLQRKT